MNLLDKICESCGHRVGAHACDGSGCYGKNYKENYAEVGIVCPCEDFLVTEPVSLTFLDRILQALKIK